MASKTPDTLYAGISHQMGSSPLVKSTTFWCEYDHTSFFNACRFSHQMSISLPVKSACLKCEYDHTSFFDARQECCHLWRVHISDLPASVFGSDSRSCLLSSEPEAPFKLWQNGPKKIDLNMEYSWNPLQAFSNVLWGAPKVFLKSRHCAVGILTFFATLFIVMSEMPPNAFWLLVWANGPEDGSNKLWNQDQQRN